MVLHLIIFNGKNYLCCLRAGSGSYAVCLLPPFQSLTWCYHIKHKECIQNCTEWKDFNFRPYVILIFRIKTKYAHAAIKSDILFIMNTFQNPSSIYRRKEMDHFFMTTSLFLTHYQVHFLVYSSMNVS